VLIISAQEDAETSISVARRLFEAVRAAFGATGGSVRMTELPGPGSLGESEAQARCMMEFFAEHLELSFKALEDDPTLIRVV
jgi:hypothetical protein